MLPTALSPPPTPLLQKLPNAPSDLEAGCDQDHQCSPHCKSDPGGVKVVRKSLIVWCPLVGLPVDTNNLARLNDDANVGEAVSYLVMALKHWGVTPTLNFQRGGAPFQTG